MAERPETPDCDEDIITVNKEATHVHDKVKFDTESYVKAATEENYEITIFREKDRIFRFRTMEELSEYSDSLMEELKELEKEKQRGCDKLYLKEQYESIDERFELLNKAKERLQPGSLKNSLKGSTRGSINQINEEAKPEHPKENRNKEKLEKLKVKIHNYLEELVSHIDVVLLFHCCTLKSSIENYFPQISDLLKNNNHLRIRICYIKSEKNLFMSDSFLNAKSNLNNLKFNEFQREKLKDIRNDFISLDWGKYSTRLLCNIAKDSCKHDFSRIEKFICNQYNDPVQELMDYNEISSYTCYITNSRYKSKTDVSFISNIEEFFSLSNFNKMLLSKIQLSLMEHVFNLKRNYFSDYDEFLKYMKAKSKSPEEKLEKSFDVISYRPKNKIKIENLFDSEGISFSDVSCEPNCSNKIEIVNFKTICSRANLLYYAKVLDQGPHESSILYKGWIEKYNHKEIAFSVLDTHLITRFFAERFNTIMKRKAILVPQCCLFKKSSDMLFVQKIGVSLDDIDTTIRLESNLLLQAFMHFTYEESKETMAVFDLRTIKLENNAILLADPIIFCSNANRFGMSNLGKKALDNLMSSHECNSFCEAMMNQCTSLKTKTYVKEDKKFCPIL